MERQVFTEAEIRNATTLELKNAHEELRRHVCGFDAMARSAAEARNPAGESLRPISAALSGEILRIERELDRRGANRPPSGTQNVGEWPVGLALAGTAIALLPLPYGYYQIFRAVLFVLLLWLSYRSGWTRRLCVALPLAILYNPIEPVYLRDKGVWTFLNIATIFVLYGLISQANVRAEARRKEVALAGYPEKS